MYNMDGPCPVSELAITYILANMSTSLAFYDTFVFITQRREPA